MSDPTGMVDLSAPVPPEDAVAPEIAGQSTGASLYHAIRGAIVTLQFAPGQQLSENQLARQFQASRTPVRDALKRLAREELVVISPRRRTTVTRLDLSTFRQFVLAREALERTAAQLAAGRSKREPEVLASCVTELAESVESGNDSSFQACDRRFHRQIMQIANLEKIHEVVEGLRGQTDRMRWAHMTYLASYDRLEVLEQHGEIANAIATGDVEVAGSAMQAHILSVFPRVGHLARMRPELFSKNLRVEFSRHRDDWRHLERATGASPA